MNEDRIKADATQSYWTGQLRPGHPALLAQFDAESAETIAMLRPATDIAYGPHPRETFDLYPGAAAPSGLLIYFHGGYWQARDKAQFRFLATAFVALGIAVALVNYPLCPDVSLEAVVASAHASIPAVLAYTATGPHTPFVIAGHSAGGHIAAELALRDRGGQRREHRPMAGIVAISGVFDLAPLLLTPINDKLALDQARAEAMSPLRRVAGPLPPAVFVVGGDETPAFQIQSANMDAAWRATGSAAQLVTVAGADHYSVLRQFTPGCAAFDATTALFFGPRIQL